MLSRQSNVGRICHVFTDSPCLSKMEKVYLASADTTLWISNVEMIRLVFTDSQWFSKKGKVLPICYHGKVR